MENVTKKRMTRREFLKTSGKTAGLVGGAIAFPTVFRSTARAAEDTVKVGIMFSLSGPYAPAGTDRTNGVLMAVEELNAKNGILGRKIETFVRDDQANPGIAATRTKELVEKEAIKFLVGGNTSACVPAMKDQTAPKKVIFMVGCMADTTFAAPVFDRTIFHIYPSAWMCGNVMGRYAAKNFGKKWYFLIADYSWGWENFNSFSAVLNEFNGTNLGVTGHPLAASDFSPYITKIMAVKPEVLIVVNGGRDQINSWKQLREFGAFEKMKIVGTVLYFSSVLGAGVDAVWGGYGSCLFYWEDQLETTRQFVDKFMKKNNRPPSDDHVIGYEGMMELASAAERVKSLDPDKIINTLEEHRFQWTKGPQYWRKCDHQAIQDLCVVTPKKPQKQYDIFQILDRMGGEKIARPCHELGLK
jgi:branched-chain amino acid transport system substrate-binding protein